MTDVQTHTDTHANAERPAGASKRNDQASQGERRSFRADDGRGEPGMRPPAAGAASAAFDQARRDLEQAAERGIWGSGLFSRQFEPFLRMQSDMIRWFDVAWRETATAWPLQRLAGLGAGPWSAAPAADLKETDGAYELSVELPGLSREDVDIAVQGDALLVSGDKQEERQQAGTAYRLNERRYGRFQRSFPLPPDVKRDQIAGAFSDGVLTVTLPKTAKAAAKRDPVQIKG